MRGLTYKIKYSSMMTNGSLDTLEALWTFPEWPLTALLESANFEVFHALWGQNPSPWHSTQFLSRGNDSVAGQHQVLRKARVDSLDFPSE